MKNEIYFFILGFLILISSIILFLYFMQDFTEEINIKSSINFDDIIIKDRTSGNKIYAEQMSATIGTLELKNNGIFTQNYNFPTLIGCLNNPEIDNYEKRIYFSYNEDEDYIKEMPYYYPDSNENPIEIKTDKSKNFFIAGTININTDIETLKKTESIYIYKIEEKTKNPIDFNIYSRDYYSCQDLISDKNPIKEIIIIA